MELFCVLHTKEKEKPLKDGEIADLERQLQIASTHLQVKCNQQAIIGGHRHGAIPPVNYYNHFTALWTLGQHV